MKCSDPILCYNSTTGKTIYRHFSLASETFKRIHHYTHNCRKCLSCRKKQSYELASRCVLHSSVYPDNCFLTLTYDESLPQYHNNFEYPDIQKFTKRLRSYIKYHSDKKADIFNVHEYGKNGKKHWHLIIFNESFKDKTYKFTRNGNRLYVSKTLEKLWPHGIHSIGDVTEASAMYQAQYTQKDFQYGNITNGKKSSSHHSGLGRPYFLQNYKQILSLGYIPFAGRKMPLPRYFEKIAHKHWCHFNDTTAFFPTKTRKEALYTPFKPGLENKEIADLFDKYKLIKQEKIQQLTEEWNDVMTKYFDSKESPDFVKSGENAIYDLNNKLTNSQF